MAASPRDIRSRAGNSTHEVSRTCGCCQLRRLIYALLLVLQPCQVAALENSNAVVDQPVLQALQSLAKRLEPHCRR